MIKIGLTGGIGSGKSFVCRIFEHFNIPIYYADKEAKKILNHLDVVNSIVLKFGNSVLSQNKVEIDRKKLADIVFADRKNLDTLDSIIHPLVFQDFENWCKQQNASYIIQEAAVLFESGFNKIVDKTILVKAPIETRIQRVIIRDRVSQEAVLSRIQNQLPENIIESKVDYVIDNGGTVLLLPQIIKIHDELMTLTKSV